MTTEKIKSHLIPTLRSRLDSIFLACDDDVKIELRPMLPKDYDCVRELLPEVTKCTLRMEKEHIEAVLQCPTFIPWCAYRCDTRNLVGYAELYVVPHLGRLFDARLERVIVCQSFRNNALATKMCAHLIQQAKEKLHCGRVDLTVENDTARHIYEKKLKFQAVKTCVMRLNLLD